MQGWHWHTANPDKQNGEMVRMLAHQFVNACFAEFKKTVKGMDPEEIREEIAFGFLLDHILREKGGGEDLPKVQAPRQGHIVNLISAFGFYSGCYEALNEKVEEYLDTLEG